MDVIEKARIRITNWIDHSELHQKEYELFGDQMEKAGKKESSIHIMEMAALSARGTECLRLALKSLDKK